MTGTHCSAGSKVKELRNAYHKSREANCCSSAVPTSCRFYKQLDAIFGGDPTSTEKATVDTSLAHVPVESGRSKEEEISDKDVERNGDPKAEDDLEVRDACSQKLFSTSEEDNQSHLSELGKVQTGEEAPAEQLCRIRKWLQRTKEDFLRDVMMHSAAEKQELKEWRDSKKRDRKENVARQNEATEQLLNVMDTLQEITSKKATLRECKVPKSSTQKLGNARIKVAHAALIQTPGISNLWPLALQGKPPGGPGRFIYLPHPQVRQIAAPTGRGSPLREAVASTSLSPGRSPQPPLTWSGE
ncbi:hypothetical protein UY3_09832 [Chelonia mydas]|uniref:Uncharacterized protein n=1 Tax=Chelonia mydas TaxID=8469 RepID=M7B7A9_CHEMY|nr:hypothetical protein UY3_09832 [Chelonia mydas]